MVKIIVVYHVVYLASVYMEFMDVISTSFYISLIRGQYMYVREGGGREMRELSNRRSSRPTHHRMWGGGGLLCKGKRQ